MSLPALKRILCYILTTQTISIHPATVAHLPPNRIRTDTVTAQPTANHLARLVAQHEIALQIHSHAEVGLHLTPTDALLSCTTVCYSNDRSIPLVFLPLPRRHLGARSSLPSRDTKFFAPSIKEQKEWDDPKRWSKEKLVKDVRYYATSCGFEIVNETVETQDGYYLRMNRIIDPQTTHKKHSDGRGGFPVLIMHGLFQSSGSFVTSEERSLAFWLARHGGYQVFLGNNRGVFDMGHRSYSRSDPRFWDYNIRELAIYDLPAMIDYIRKDTGYDRIAYIGHSQGNGTMFISLSKGMVPELGQKLTYFGALAPAVYAGPLTSCFPFTTLGKLEWKEWKRFFGVLDFIPLMKISYDWTPAYPYALLGYQMFAFLFAWTDANWLLRRKAKMFRFTPQPVSSASIYWWAGKDGFASRGCVLDPSLDQWWDDHFPPLSIFSGGMDFLVLTDPLIERLEKKEKKVKLLRFKRQDEAEHCDHFWAADAVEWCFNDILDDIEGTRERYPEEIEEEQKRERQRERGRGRRGRGRTGRVW